MGARRGASPASLVGMSRNKLIIVPMCNKHFPSRVVSGQSGGSYYGDMTNRCIRYKGTLKGLFCGVLWGGEGVGMLVRR